MSRRSPFFALGLLGLLLAGPAAATVGPSIAVRWSGDLPAPARRGQELVGHFELVSGNAGRIENFRVQGDGWDVRSFDGPPALVLPPRSHRRFTFRAVPTDPHEPLVVSGTVNGVPFTKRFTLDEERLARYGKPGEAKVTGRPQAGKLPGTQSQLIRCRGRVIYTRTDNVVIGVDNIPVTIMDHDDPPYEDEQMGLVLTDSQGYFDITIPWTDFDGPVQDDPDIYLKIETSNLVCQVRNDDLGDSYDWTTISWVFNDYTGNDLQFGDVIPLTDVGALPVWNSIIRANRHAREQAGMPATHVFVNWPSTDDGTYYSQSIGELFIASSETWNEGTCIHEYGHALSDQFSVLNPSNYVNGFCDTPKPGHCVWCPENDNDAWQEGFADWFGGRLMRVWKGAYGVDPLDIDDPRYDLETPGYCNADASSYDSTATEGYVGALLEDIEDSQQDGYGPACILDMLDMGDVPIFTVFRDDDPATVQEFIAKFRARYPSYARDFWATIQNTIKTANFPEPPVVVSTLPTCRIARIGETLDLEVFINGGLAKFRWRKDGVPVDDGGGISGAFTSRLTLGPLTAAMAGNYDCVATPCSASPVTSTAMALHVEAAPLASQFISWGENGSGQVGNGATSYGADYYLHPDLPNVIQVDGGRSYSMLLRSDGQVMTWGNEQWGELGNGNQPFSQVNAPSAIGITDAVRISAGKYYGLAIGRDGRIRGWGYNFNGQLFLGDRTDRMAPETSYALDCVKEIAAGDEFSLALLQDGTVWSVGYNQYGCLGKGTMGPTETTPGQIPTLSNVIDVEAAYLWGMALKGDGTVWTWGINTWGNLGLGHYSAVATPTQVPGLNNIVQISAGVDNGYALRADGTLFAWGYGPAIGIGWTGGSSNVPQQVPLANVQRVEGGSDYALALLPGGRLKAWGMNGGQDGTTVGVLGNKGPYAQGSPVDVPYAYPVTGFGAGWVTAHAFGQLAALDVPNPDESLPTVLALAATPNPSRALAAIAFDLPKGGAVALSIYDVAGRMVKTLAHESLEPGRYTRTWDGTADGGARARAGVYFVRLAAPGGALTRTLVRLD